MLRLHSSSPAAGSRSRLPTKPTERSRPAARWQASRDGGGRRSEPRPADVFADLRVNGDSAMGLLDEIVAEKAREVAALGAAASPVRPEPWKRRDVVAALERPKGA